MATRNTKRHLRNVSTGAGINGATFNAFLHSGGGSFATDATDADGLAELDTNYPGPHYTQVIYNGKTINNSSREVGFIGTFSGADLPTAFRAFDDGVLDDYLNEMSVAAGVGLSVDVATGAAIVLGHPFENDATTNVVLAVADPTNPRIDRIVLRLSPRGTATEGKIILDKLTGTPAGSPVAPNVTQDATTWEISLATVAVPANAAAPGAITDTRIFLSPSYVNPANIAPGTVDSTEFGHLNGVTSAIQTQLNAKAPTANPTFTGTVTADVLTTTGNVTLGNAGADTVTTAGPLSVGGALTVTGAAALNGATTVDDTLNVVAADAESIVFRNGATKRVVVDLFNANGEVQLRNGAMLSTFSDNGATVTARIDGNVGSILANGTATFNGATLTAGGSTRLEVNSGRIVIDGTAPTVAAGAAAGATATIGSLSATDAWGRFVLTPSGAGIGAGVVVTVTFNTARSNTAYMPVLDVGDADAAGAVAMFFADHGTLATTGFEIRSTGALTSGTTYRLGYHIMGK